MEHTEFKLAATGDSFITRRLPSRDPDAARLAELMVDADFRFTNLEVVVRRQEGFPSAQSGGTWATTRPESLDDLRAYGFNLLAWANNHTLDYSYGGLAATAKYLAAGGWLHAGVGDNLAAAAAPGFLECRAGRIAFLAITSSFHESWKAGASRPEIGGRPGVNPLRSETRYLLSAEQLAGLAELAADCGINRNHELQVKEGFAKPDPPGVLRFGEQLFALDEDGRGERVVSRANRLDLERMVKSIKYARSQSDLVVVSLHAHQMKGGRKERPADFIVEFAHACIDAGADAVVGHGPHVLRPIEIYRRRPIFYSLGNFIFQNETVPYLPADFYEKYGIDPTASTSEALETRSERGRRGLAVNPRVWHSVVARWTMRDGELASIRLHPISLGFGWPRYRQGWPRLSSDLTPLSEIKKMSHEQFATELEFEGNTLTWNKG